MIVEERKDDMAVDMLTRWENMKHHGDLAEKQQNEDFSDEQKQIKH